MKGVGGSQDPNARSRGRGPDLRMIMIMLMLMTNKKGFVLYGRTTEKWNLPSKVYLPRLLTLLTQMSGWGWCVWGLS